MAKPAYLLLLVHGVRRVLHLANRAHLAEVVQQVVPRYDRARRGTGLQIVQQGVLWTRTRRNTYSVRLFYVSVENQLNLTGS